MAQNGKRRPLVAPKKVFKSKKTKASISSSVASSLAAKMTPGAAKKKAAPKSKGGFWSIFARKGKSSAKAATPKAQPTQKRAAPAKPKRNIFVRFIRFVCFGILRIFWWVFFRVSIVTAVVVGSSTAYYYSTLPDAAALMDDRQRGSVTILDEAGQVFAWRGDQFGGLVDANSVAPHLKNAVVATEDKRFYRHLGISPRGIAGAIRTNLREGRHPLKGHGGSTITQQVSKLVFFSDMGSIERKIKEVPMAFAMELKYTKDEILTIYMNRAYLGAGSNGFEAAAQRYFSKSASEVSVAEAAMMAGLLKAPSSTAPTRNIGKAQDRANLIIGLMEDQKKLSASEARFARNNPAQLSATAKSKVGTYFADWIVEAGPDFILKDTKEDLVIRSTFDKRVQKAAEEGLNFIFENKVREGSKAQAAVVVLSRDGAVRALVGGKKTGNAGGFNRATQALRQTGSSFKPFVYAAALNDGWRWDTKVVDERFTMNVPGSGEYSPKNYTKKYEGEMTMTTALAKSKNTVAVKVAVAIGTDKVAEIAQGFGIKNKINPGPSMALGASESTLLEMTGAYAGILNGGVAVTPYGVMELTLQGDRTPLIVHSNEPGERVISQGAAEQLMYMMNQVVENGSGRKAQIAGVEIAGKTGTTQGAKDAWFIGFNNDYVVGVWMGYDDNTKLTGVTGSGLPTEIWRETMTRVLDGHVPAPLPMFVPRTPVIEEPKVATRTDRKKGANEALRDLTDQVERDIKKLEEEAENIVDKVLGSIFGRKKN
ncbi:PBP1A family penicillin-binding protein [Amylibacter sp. IMCC11727]|uniref:transglycosylase domain-containing protein n=1 Tax=Amylibacter sp. IMCC11727 TaxID=3039851 RepID=UPI00244E1DCB|nr:PBP1A family penicillin-binding protein [Amylibacter sp. IMCC11727]WGI21780.1 PBP1A family penicillin-binding protein [Amylibacter sp. IMCC11727]